MSELYSDLIRDLHHLIKDEVDGLVKKPSYIKNFTQARIIFYLVENKDKEIYQKDICEQLKLKKSSITEHLDYLESEGAIKRIPDEIDHRKNRIVIAERVKNSQEHFKSQLSIIDKKLTKDITKKELEEFTRIIEKMEKNLKG